LAVGAGEEVVPTSEYRALQYQVRELQRLLGKKTLENEILREALDLAQPKKTAVAVTLARAGRLAVEAISDTLGVARSNLAVQAAAKRSRQRRGRRPQPEAELVAEIKGADSPVNRPTVTGASMRCSGVSAANRAVRQ
jgi:transposase